MGEGPRHDPGHPSTAVASTGAGAGPATAVETIDPRIESRIDSYLAHNPGGAELLIPLLHLAQASLGYVPDAVQERIAERLALPLVQVHGVVSFYHFFSTGPRARHPLRVCMGTACFVRRARALTEAIRQVLGVDRGGVTKDGQFGLEEVRCLGACGMAPVLMLDGDTHGNLTPGEARKLVLELQTRARRDRIHASSEAVDD